MGWLIFFGIVGVYAYGFKFFYSIALKSHFLSWEKEREIEASRYPSLYAYPPTLLDYEKEMDMAKIDAVFLAILWPFSWIYFIAKKLVVMKVEPNTPMYQKRKEEKELKELRKLAREHGLKLPEMLDS